MGWTKNLISFFIFSLVIILLLSQAKAKHFPLRGERAGSPPVAVLPSDKEMDVGGSVTISGAMSSDPDGDTLSYHWSFDVLPEGSNAKIDGPTGASISFTADVIGFYLIKLIVHDGSSNSDFAYMAITVRAANQLPVIGGAWAGVVGHGLPMKVDMGFSEYATDPDGEVVSYEFNFGDGKSTRLTAREMTVRDWNNPFLAHYYGSAGDYTIQITAIDDRGGRSTGTVDITVTDRQVPVPKFSATVVPNSKNPNNYDIRLDGTAATNPNGAIINYSWEIHGPDGFHNYSDPSYSTKTHTVTAGNEGEYHIAFYIKDSDHQYFPGVRATVYVGVSDPPPGRSAPSLIYSTKPRLGQAPLTVVFDASQSFDLEGDNVSVHWRFGDFSAPAFGASGGQVSHTYRNPGTYIASVMVRDSHGNQRSEYFRIHVKGSRDRVIDIAEIGINQHYDPNGRMFHLDYTNNLIVLDNIPASNMLWDFGDGERERGRHRTHQYSKDGTYLVKLTTVDVDGVVQRAQKELVVRSDAGPPVAIFDVDDSLSNPGQTLTFDHSYSESITGAKLRLSYFFDDDTPFFGNVLGSRMPHTFARQGLYNVTLFAEEEGQTSYDHRLISVVIGQTYHPSFSITPRVGIAPLTATVDGSFSPHDSMTTTYNWFFGEDRNVNPGQYATGVRATHTYQTPGHYHIELGVTDSAGNITFAGHDILVIESANPNNQSPVANFTVHADGLSVELNAASSMDSDGEIVFYDWDYGDGSIRIGDDPRASYTYGEAGTYTITLKIYDNDGATHTITGSVTVTGVSSSSLAEKSNLKETPISIVYSNEKRYEKILEDRKKYSNKSGCERINGRQHCYQQSRVNWRRNSR